MPSVIMHVRRRFPSDSRWRSNRNPLFSEVLPPRGNKEPWPLEPQRFASRRWRTFAAKGPRPEVEWRRRDARRTRVAPTFWWIEGEWEGCAEPSLSGDGSCPQLNRIVSGRLSYGRSEFAREACPALQIPGVVPGAKCGRAD